MAELDGLNHAGDDLTRTVLELLELTLTLGIADLLEDHLLGRLRVDPSQIDRGQRINDEIADAGVLLQLLTLLQIDLLEMILDLFDHLDHAPQLQIAGLHVELRTDVVLGTVARARSALDRFLERFDDDRLVDHLLLRHRIGDCEQFCLVGGNRAGHVSLLLSLHLSI